MHEIRIALDDQEFDAVAAGVPGEAPREARVQSYLEGQVAAVVAQHVENARKAALRDAGLPEALLEARLEADEIQALKVIRAEKRAVKAAAEAEAAANAVSEPIATVPGGEG